MLQHLKHLPQNTQFAETLLNLIAAPGQNPLIYDGADRALFRIVAAVKHRDDFLGFLIELSIEDRENEIECCAPVLLHKSYVGFIA